MNVAGKLASASWCIVAAACVVLSPSPSIAQITVHPNPESARLIKLDKAAEQADFGTITESISQAASNVEAREYLDWVAFRFIQGDSVFFAFTYSKMLAELAEGLPAEQAKGIKSMALSALLYASSVSLVDGLQCGDRTARTNRRDQLSVQLASSPLLILDEPERKMAAWLALQIERKTWLTRRARNDARFQCANGMAAMNVGIAAGQTRERPSRAGEIGGQVEVTVPADFVYVRRTDTEWWAEAELMRSKLPELIAIAARIERIPSEAEIDALQGAK